MAKKMQVIEYNGKWEIENVPGVYGLVGPYDTKKEAEETRVRLGKSIRHINKPEWFLGVSEGKAWEVKNGKENTVDD